MKLLSAVALVILIIQIALGGWTSANYAALACPDFPLCFGEIIPAEFSLAGAINSTSRISIQVLHRLGAFITTIVLLILLVKIPFKLRMHLGGLLLIQLLLGVSNVMLQLPLGIAVAHNAVAALLLLALVKINYYVHTIAK